MQRKNLLYVLAIIFLLAWAVGVFFYAAGLFIHLLLIFAGISIAIRFLRGKSSQKEKIQQP